MSMVLETPVSDLDPCVSQLRNRYTKHSRSSQQRPVQPSQDRLPYKRLSGHRRSRPTDKARILLRVSRRPIRIETRGAALTAEAMAENIQEHKASEHGGSEKPNRPE